jgi:hypothetical protein
VGQSRQGIRGLRLAILSDISHDSISLRYWIQNRVLAMELTKLATTVAFAP